MAGRTLKQLLDAATFRNEYWLGTYQDLSPTKRTMTNPFVCKFARVGNSVAICSRKNGEIRTSGNVACVVDPTTTYTLEMLTTTVNGMYMIYQVSGGGIDAGISGGQAFLRSNAGGAAVRAITFGSGLSDNKERHLLVSFSPQTPTGKAWISGVPVSCAFTNTGVPAVCADTVLYLIDANRNSLVNCKLIRFWAGGVDDDEAATLYNASRSLVTG